jgi:hypothetical protein
MQLSQAGEGYVVCVHAIDRLDFYCEELCVASTAEQTLPGDTVPLEFCGAAAGSAEEKVFATVVMTASMSPSRIIRFRTASLGGGEW